MENSTIAAIATPGGRGGIGIVKISGSRALAIAAALFHPAVSQSPTQSERSGPAMNESADRFKSHRLHYGHIIDPVSRQVLDEVLLSVMEAPRSYTREDVVEINAHGGQIAVNAIFEAVLRQGARIAEPGEFTKRAFLNGRIDLIQAEAVIDAINARTEKSLHLAATQIRGTLSRSVEQIRQHLIELLTRTEAIIDFPDDVDEIFDPGIEIDNLEKSVLQPLISLIQKHIDGNVLRDGLRVAVVGRPNVGKSSLLNCLVQKERAIVTAVPGTTRDAIEETINMKGLPVLLIDTAGLHETNDPIETIGIEKTIENFNRADLVLFMVEATRKLTAEDHKIFEQLQSKPTIVLINKIDLVIGKDIVEIPAHWSSCKCLRTSALYDRGIEALKEEVAAMAFGKNPLEIEAGIVPNLRQKMLLEDGLKATRAMIDEFNNGYPAELIAIHLQDAVDALGQILGTTVKVDVLDQIFSRFCIGK
jgi:tRNA modification GTPase